MKRVGILILSILLTAGYSFSQERGGGERPSKSSSAQGRKGGNRPQMNPDEMVKRQTQRLVEALKLNKDQEAKVLAINKKYMAKQSADFGKMRDASDDDRKKMFETMKKVHEEKDKEIKAVLTPDQLKLYAEMEKKREEMRKKGQGFRNGGPDGGPAPRQ